jgi:hypothetical protein
VSADPTHSPLGLATFASGYFIPILSRTFVDFCKSDATNAYRLRLRQLDQKPFVVSKLAVTAYFDPIGGPKAGPSEPERCKIVNL